MNIFKRSISKKFIEQLQEAAKGGWWKDALADPQLFIALRGSSLNVYYRGFSTRATSAANPRSLIGLWLIPRRTSTCF
jgi:hypothetical protein